MYILKLYKEFVDLYVFLDKITARQKLHEKSYGRCQNSARTDHITSGLTCIGNRWYGPI